MVSHFNPDNMVDPTYPVTTAAATYDKEYKYYKQPLVFFFFFVIYCNIGGSRVWNPVLWNVRYRTVVFCADVVIAKVSFLLTSPAPHISLPASPCVPPSHRVLLTLAPPQHWPRGVSSLPPSIRFTLAGSMTQQLGKICPVFRLLTYMATVRLSVLLHWRDLDHLTT